MVQLHDLFGVLCISVGVSCLIELAQWLIIYRKSRFRQFKERLALQTKKLGELKSAGAGKGKSKKQERLENSMKVETGRQFSAMKLQQMLIVMGTMGVAYKLLSYSYGGVVVAKLPFEPWGFFQKITHRGLEGSDPSDAAMTLVFSLAQMGLRHNLASFLDLGPSRQMQGMMAQNNAMLEGQMTKQMK